ncbi:unnamed protein product, partial [Sphacelaria rigidula]
MSELENSPMNTGENPDDYFNQKHLLRAQIEKMRKPISDRRFKDICVQGFSDEYNDVKVMVFRDPTFDVLQMQSTLRNIFMDAQSRKGSNGRITGRGFAMTTAVSEVVCHDCNKTGHIRRNCPRCKPKGKKKTKPAGATKWCAIHNTTTHSDEECYKQGAKRPEETKEASEAFSACSHCAHCASFSTSKETSNEKAAIDFTREEDDFDGGFMFSTFSSNRGWNFTASATRTPFLVDSGASE